MLFSILLFWKGKLAYNWYQVQALVVNFSLKILSSEEKTCVDFLADFSKIYGEGIYFSILIPGIGPDKKIVSII